MAQQNRSGGSSDDAILRMIAEAMAEQSKGGSAPKKPADATPPEVLTRSQLQEIVTFACTAASLSTTRPGGASSVPTLSEIEAFRGR